MDSAIAVGFATAEGTHRSRLGRFYRAGESRWLGLRNRVAAGVLRVLLHRLQSSGGPPEFPFAESRGLGDRPAQASAERDEIVFLPLAHRSALRSEISGPAARSLSGESAAA